MSSGFVKARVLKTNYGDNDKVSIIWEDKENNLEPYAVCVKGVDPKPGDIVEIYHDDHVHYRGSSAMVLRVVKE